MREAGLLATGIWDHLSRMGGHLYALALALGGPGLFFIALADSSFLSIPEANDILIVVLSIGQSWEAMSYYVLMTIAGSAAGCSLLYSVGRRGGSFLRKRLNREKMEWVRRLYQRWGVWTIVIPCLLPPPTPFKIFVLSAGVFQLSFVRFLLAILVGRSVRYFTWGILALLYGQAAQRYLEKNLHTIGTVLLVLFLAIIALYLSLRMRKKSVPQELG